MKSLTHLFNLRFFFRAEFDSLYKGQNVPIFFFPNKYSSFPPSSAPTFVLQIVSQSGLKNCNLNNYKRIS